MTTQIYCYACGPDAPPVTEAMHLHYRDAHGWEVACDNTKEDYRDPRQS